MSSNSISGPHGRDLTGADAPMVAEPAKSVDQISFHDVLEALNPLQYLPVVGTIYRAVTGDEGSPPLRTAASLIGGLLTGGPVGFVTSAVSELAEHFFHLDKVAGDLLSRDPAVDGKPAVGAALAAYRRAGETAS